MMPRLLLAALTLTCAAAFVAPHNVITHHDVPTTTSLAATSSRRAALASLVGFTLTAQTASAAVQSSVASSGVLLSKGAYVAEAGFDDFSGGLTMPKYTVDSNALGSPLDLPAETNPKKLAKMQEKAAAAAAKAEAAKEAGAAAKRKAAAAEAGKLEANAAKIQAKEDAKARQVAQMSPEQQAKIEAYNTAKKEAKNQPNAMNSMKKMYGL